MASAAPIAEPVPAAAAAAVPETATAEPTQTEEKKPRTYKKRKTGNSTAPPPVATSTPADALQPLPEDATGFRKRSKKEDYTPVPSSSVPGMSVGEIRKAGEAIRSEHLLFNGWPAGTFALAILRGNHNKRRERKQIKDGVLDDDAEDEDEKTPADVEAPAATQ